MKSATGCNREILPGRDGLVHISELEPRRVERVEDVCQVGDEIVVKVIGVDEKGKIRLSRKQAMEPGTHTEAQDAGGDQPRRERRDRNDRDRNRGDRPGRPGGDRPRGDRPPRPERDRGPRPPEGTRFSKEENNTGAIPTIEPEAEKPREEPLGEQLKPNDVAPPTNTRFDSEVENELS